MKPIISVTSTIKPDFDSMERTIAPPPGGDEQRETPTPNAKHTNHLLGVAANDECWVAEGRSPALEGEREAQP